MKIALLYLISLITRFFFFFDGFPSITHDEADIFINGFVFSKTGTDVWGNNLFMTSGILSANSPVAIYLSAIFFHIFPKTVFFARLPFLIINSFLPLLLFLIANKLTKNKNLSLMVFLTANFSPWLNYISSQSAFNAPLALTFYCLSLLIILSVKKPVIRYSLFIILSFISYNSYLGFSTVFLFFVFAALLLDYQYWNKKIKLINIIGIFGISASLFLVFTSLLYLGNGTNIYKNTQSKIVKQNIDLITNKVWHERLVNPGGILIKKALSNKVTVTVDLILSRYVNAFNPSILFVKGDPHAIYGTNSFGLFYLWESILLLIGLIKLFELFKKNGLFIRFVLLILVLAPLPIIFQNEITLAFRSIMLIIPLSFLIGLGLYYLQKKYQVKTIYFIIFYVINFLIFFGIYHYKVKNVSSEQWHYGEKQIFDKISTDFHKFKKIFIINNEPVETMLLYGFYKIPSAMEIKSTFYSSPKTTGKITFSGNCPPNISPENLYIIKRETCKKEKYDISPYYFAFDKSGILYYKIEGRK